MMAAAGFISGVVEGFYGPPWRQADRLLLLDRLAAWGLNTYFYAPKDDLKHRALWRELYDAEETCRLGDLIRACQSRGLRFIYGLSPGLDIGYARPEDRLRLKNRCAQLLGLGCRAFALLFDDIPADLSPADREHFDSFAGAQSAVTNELHRWLRDQEPGVRLLFCPTAYCGRMADQGLGGARYLEVLGQALDAAIDVFWTGPEIVSREMTPASLEPIQRCLQRPPVLWDNLHANDYDLRRLYCGPYAGRPPELCREIRGVLLNPNVEFAVNFVPIRTLSSYVANPEAYEPRAAYLQAVREWLSEFETIRVPMAPEDLVLLCDCYYLPHEEGPEANRLYARVRRMLHTPPSGWGDDFAEFQKQNRQIQALFERLTELRRRELFYAFSRRMWELKEEMQLMEKCLLARQEEASAPVGFQSGEHLPGTYRGGIVARLQRLVEPDGAGRFRIRQPAEPEGQSS